MFFCSSGRKQNDPIDPVSAETYGEIQKLKSDLQQLEQQLQQSQRAVDNLKIGREADARQIAEHQKEIQQLQAAEAEAKRSAKTVKERVNTWFRNREESYLRTVFDAHQCDQCIVRADLPKVLEAMNVCVSDADMDILFKTMDINGDDKLDFEELKRHFDRPNTLEQWTADIPFSRLVANAIPVTNERDPLNEVSRLDMPAITTICDGIREGMIRLLSQHVKLLKDAYETTAEFDEGSDSASAKYQVVSMSCGKIADFYKGLEGRVGSPHLNFDQAMEAEHCIKAGFDYQFTTGNYSTTTTPSFEWRLVAAREGKSESEWAALLREGGEFGRADMGHGRRILDVGELMLSKTSLSAKLARCEVVAVVLYTGPMFQIYNTILRRWPKDAYNVFKQGGNQFASTIHALVSAVQKVSRTMRIPEGTLLYRGLGGTLDLPDCFLTADENGCRGFAEWGFMSTTADKSIALKYSGVEQAKPLATVLVIKVGAVARGACIRDFSQYPQEVEYLWVPCSFLEPSGERSLQVTAHGVVRMIPVAVSANLKAPTVEELVGKKKSMHMAALHFTVDEVRHELEDQARSIGLEERLAKDISRDWNRQQHTVDYFLQCIVKECEAVVKRHAAVPSSQYIVDEVFRRLVTEMMEVKVMALSRLQIYVEDTTKLISIFLKQFPLRSAYRMRISFLRRRLDAVGGPQRGTPEYRKAAIEVCKLKGLLQKDVHETNELRESRLVSAAADGANRTDLALLLAAGAHVDGLTPSGCSAMMEAARYGHADAVEMLIGAGADVNRGDTADGFTALIFAAEHGHAACVKALLEAQADVNGASYQGSVPISFAAQSGHADCVEALVRGGADVSIGRPLFFAAETGHTECVRILAEAKASVDERGGSGTALQAAERGGHTECAELLRSLGRRALLARSPVREVSGP